MKLFLLKKLKIHIIINIIAFFIVILSINNGETNSIDYNIYPIKALNSEEVTQDLKENLMVISFFDLSFELDELLKLLQDDISFKNIWIKKIQTYFTIYNNKTSYLKTDKEVIFFYNTLERRHDLVSQYPVEVEFLKKYCLDLQGRTYLTAAGYVEILKKYDNPADDYVELSGALYKLLILDGLNFVNKIKEDKNVIDTYLKWLKDLKNTQFVTYSLPINPEVIKRKRDYFVNKYENCQEPLILEAMKYIKDAEILIIE